MSRRDRSPPNCGASQPEWLIDSRPFERAGELLATAAKAVLERREHVRLAIPGGSALEAVRLAHRQLGAAWGGVRLTWVDERCVPTADPESNRGAGLRAGLLGPSPSPERVLALYEDEETPEEAMSRWRIGWTRDFSEGLDIALLGMGPDGHIASLFPSRSMPQEGWVAHVADSPKPPSNRITLTRAALSTASQIILVAAGESKRAALDGLRAGDEALPAQGLEGLQIVTDLALET